MGKLRLYFHDSKICTAGKQQIWPVCLAQKPLPSSHLPFLLRLPPSVVEKEVQLAVGSHSGSELRLVFGGLVYQQALVLLPTLHSLGLGSLIYRMEVLFSSPWSFQQWQFMIYALNPWPSSRMVKRPLKRGLFWSLFQPSLIGISWPVCSKVPGSFIPMSRVDFIITYYWSRPFGLPILLACYGPGNTFLFCFFPYPELHC